MCGFSWYCVLGASQGCGEAVWVQFGGPEEIYDVYVNQPEPLEEGVEKHVISVFVADESGIINRVAGVFARRGACV